MHYLFINGQKTIAIDKVDASDNLFIDGKDVTDGHKGEVIEDAARKLSRSQYQDFFRKQIKNLVVLSGAGTSVGIGEDGHEGLLMSQLWDAEKDKLSGKTFDELCSEVGHDANDKNLETLLSKMDGHINFGQDAKKVEALEKQRKILLELIIDKCTLKGSKEKSEFPHAIFLDKITQRKVTLPRVKVFTLNYDTLFEQAANLIQSVVLDGFSFLNPREFSGRQFDFDIVQREKSRMKDEDNFISRLFHLYKLHGSLNWERRDGKIQISENPEHPLIIFPRESKYENSYEQPFFEMMARFQQNLRLESTVLLCIGYSFNDKHVNIAINEALDQNPGFQLVIVNLNFTEHNPDFRQYIEKAKTSERITLIDDKFEDFANWFPEIQTYRFDSEIENLNQFNEPQD